jgi:cytochrome c
MCGLSRLMRRRSFARLHSFDTFLILAPLALASCTGEQGSSRNTPPDAPLAARMSTADADHGARLFRQCAGCHTIGEGAGDRGGPGLYGVVGRVIGAGSSRYAYTGALREKGGTWTPDALDRWLANPQRFVPGTKMVFAGMSDGNDRADVIAYLAANGPKLPR